jgi:AsmA protein
MSRPIKFLAWLVAALVAIFALAAIYLLLFFDPNDFREEIAAAVTRETGRELAIDGDVSLAIFPWLAVEVGHTTLGNAAGFDDKPFAEFDRAKLSIQILPMLLRREIAIGAAELETLALNLQVDARGRNNWDDLIAEKDAAEDEAAEAGGRRFEVSGVNVSDTTITYSDRQSGETYVLSQMDMKLGRVSGDGQPVPASGSFLFDVQPDGISGDVELDTEMSFNLSEGLVTFDSFAIEGVVEGIATSPTRLAFDTDRIEVQTEKEIVTMQPVDLTVLGLDIKADVEPFSYQGAIRPNAVIQIDAFSPRSLMHLLDVESPETADPGALSKVIVDADAAVKEKSIELRDVTIKLDDTTFKGSLTVPRNSSGAYRFDLSADRINVDRYMAPVDTASEGAAGESVPTEIPADLIRPLNARGNLRIAAAAMGGMDFENVVLGLNTANGRMRIHPITANLFGGSYSGDVRIDAAGNTAVLSVDEKIQDVNLADLARAMFKQDNITGSINGGFKLSGRGNDMAAIQRSLGGTMAFQLNDGSYEGTDIWYEMRRARALLKGGEPPEPELPPRTKFSTVKATGVVRDGVMRNDDLFAELPYMQLSGGGDVDLVSATVDYDLTARVLERPESLSDVTAEELDEFTEAVIPLKITGSLSSPSVKPDVEKLLRKRVEEEVKDRLLDKLLGGKKKTPPAEDGATEQPPAEGGTDEQPPAEGEPEVPEEEPDIEDQLKDKLKDLFD